jgi:hypothetical protein
VSGWRIRNARRRCIGACGTCEDADQRYKQELFR